MQSLLHEIFLGWLYTVKSMSKCIMSSLSQRWRHVCDIKQKDFLLSISTAAANPMGHQAGGKNDVGSCALDDDSS